MDELRSTRASAVDWAAGAACVEMAGVSGPVACPEAEWTTHRDSINWILGAYPWTDLSFNPGPTSGGGQSHRVPTDILLCSGLPGTPDVFADLDACYHSVPRCLFGCNIIYAEFDWNVNVWALLSEYDAVAAQTGGACELDALSGTPLGFHATDAGGGWTEWTVTVKEECDFYGCECDGRLTVWADDSQPGVYFEGSLVNNSTAACTMPEFQGW